MSVSMHTPDGAFPRLGRFEAGVGLARRDGRTAAEMESGLPDASRASSRKTCLGYQPDHDTDSRTLKLGIALLRINRGEAGPLAGCLFRNGIAKPVLSAGLIPAAKTVVKGTWQISSDIFSAVTTALAEVPGVILTRPLNALVGDMSAVQATWRKNVIAGGLHFLGWAAVQLVNVAQVGINLSALATSRIAAAAAVLTVVAVGVSVAIVAAPFLGIAIAAKKAFPHIKAALEAAGRFIKEKAPIVGKAVGNAIVIALATIAYPFIAAVRAIHMWRISPSFKEIIIQQGQKIAELEAYRALSVLGRQDGSITAEIAVIAEDMAAEQVRAAQAFLAQKAQEREDKTARLAAQICRTTGEKFAAAVKGIWTESWSAQEDGTVEARIGRKVLLREGSEDIIRQGCPVKTITYAQWVSLSDLRTKLQHEAERNMRTLAALDEEHEMSGREQFFSGAGAPPAAEA